MLVLAAGTAVWCRPLYDGSPPAAAHDGAVRTYGGQGRIQQYQGRIQQ